MFECQCPIWSRRLPVERLTVLTGQRLGAGTWQTLNKDALRDCPLFLIYMARPERLFGALRLTPAGPPAKPALSRMTASPSLELPTAWFVVFQSECSILLFYWLIIDNFLSDKIRLFGLCTFICGYLLQFIGQLKKVVFSSLQSENYEVFASRRFSRLPVHWFHKRADPDNYSLLLHFGGLFQTASAD